MFFTKFLLGKLELKAIKNLSYNHRQFFKYFSLTLLTCLTLLFFWIYSFKTGIIDLGGNIKYLDFPFNVFKQEADYFQIFREKQKFTLKQDLPTNIPVESHIDALWTPEKSEWNKLSDQPIPKGTQINSYYIYINPVGSKDIWLNSKGTITFSKPILGIVGSGENLILTNKMLGLPWVKYGVEYNYLDAPNGHNISTDTVKILGKGNILKLDFTTQRGIDPIRVITKA